MANPRRKSVYLFPPVGGAARPGVPVRPADPIWVPTLAVQAIHHDLRRRPPGVEAGSAVRDLGALDEALARPRALWDHHPGSDLATLAAAYIVGITTAHPFTHGNLRTAFVTAEVFLRLNGHTLTHGGDGILSAMRLVAAGELSEWKLADWFRDGLVAAA